MITVGLTAVMIDSKMIQCKLEIRNLYEFKVTYVSRHHGTTSSFSMLLNIYSTSEIRVNIYLKSTRRVLEDSVLLINCTAIHWAYAYCTRYSVTGEDAIFRATEKDLAGRSQLNAQTHISFILQLRQFGHHSKRGINLWAKYQAKKIDFGGKFECFSVIFVFKIAKR